MNTTQLLGSQQLRYSKFLAAALYTVKPRIEAPGFYWYNSL